MIKSIKKEVESLGNKCQIVSIERLNDLKKDFNLFMEKEELNNFQKYIINNLFKFEIPDTIFDPKSIIIIAVPNPAYAEVEFIWQGKKYKVKSLAFTNINSENAPTVARQYLKNFLQLNNFHLEYAPDLPYKRLAVRSDLAVYGRNNICYINGMGSFLTFDAFFTDVPCTNETWKEVIYADICLNCRACIDNCPTRAIRDDQFLINNEKCLSYYNEVPGEFPEWIPITAHNCIYDCLKCQIICPMNKEFLNNVIGPIRFNEQETADILAGKQFNEFNPDLQKKIKILGMDSWLKAIPRNLKVLFEQKK